VLQNLRPAILSPSCHDLLLKKKNEAAGELTASSTSELLIHTELVITRLR